MMKMTGEISMTNTLVVYYEGKIARAFKNIMRRIAHYVVAKSTTPDMRSEQIVIENNY